MSAIRSLGLAMAAGAGMLAASGVAQAQSDLAAALRAGIVGEQYDGYMGLAAPSTQSIRRQVAAINIRRRTLYIDLAQRRRVTPQIAGIATGCELLARVSPGEAYMLSDGVWRRRAAGEPPPSPPHCRRSN